MSRLVSQEEAQRLLDGARGPFSLWLRDADGDWRIVAHDAPMKRRRVVATCGYAKEEAAMLAAAPDLAHTVIALTAERDEAHRELREARRLHVALRAALDAETGKGAPGDWTRNDIDPKREGIAWYRRWEADGSEPGEDDTDTTRVAWVRHDSEADMTMWCWEIEAPTLGVFGKRVAHGEGFASAYEALEACDDYAEIEVADLATKDPA